MEFKIHSIQYRKGSELTFLTEANRKPCTDKFDLAQVLHGVRTVQVNAPKSVLL